MKAIVHVNIVASILSITSLGYINRWHTMCTIKNLPVKGYLIFISIIFYINEKFFEAFRSPLKKKKSFV